jgi:dienelactone hydrolase
MTDYAALAALWASVPRLSTVHLSGNGRWLFWSWEGLHEVAEVYRLDLQGGVPERLTFSDDHVHVRDVNADGSAALLATSRNADEHDQLLLWRNGSLSELTPEQHDHYLYGGRFLPDGDVVFIANFDYDAGQVTKGGWLWRVTPATGARRCLIRTDSVFEDGADPSPDGKSLIWKRHDRAPGGDQLWLIASDGSGAREVLSLHDRSRLTARWLDNTRIVFVTDGPENDRIGLLSLPDIAVTWLIEEPDFNPQDLVVGRSEYSIVAYRNSQVFAELLPDRRAFPNPTGRRHALPLAAFPDGSWLVEAYDADAPHAVFRVRDDKAQVLLEAPPVSGCKFIRPRDWWWTSPDGTRCQGWLYQPDGPSKGLIVWVHGGPTWHSEDWVNPKIAFYVQAGFTVLDPNYRGSTGFGQAFREAIKQDGWGGREQDDIRSGIESLIAAGLAQRGKIGVIGISYGGYSSWFAITRMADLVNAAVPVCGMYRLDTDYDETGMPHGRAYSEEMMGGAPNELAEKYRAASPGNYINDIRGAVMVVHGMADSNVSPANSFGAVSELSAAGIPHDVLFFDNEGHGVNRRSNLETFMIRTAEFLERTFR